MKKSVIGHLDELRSRLIVTAIAFILLSVIGIYFSGWFVSVLISNLTLNIPVTFVSLSPFEFIAAQIKLGLFIGIVLSAPVLAYELAMFVQPALRKKERKYVYSSAPVSIILFGLGFAFAYFVFLKIALVYLGTMGLKYGVENMWSIGTFVSTVFLTCILIGLVFEMPLLAFMLSRIGMLRREPLSGKRAYIYVLILIIAAVITPPDLVTQILIAVPMILLYEASVLLVRR